MTLIARQIKEMLERNLDAVEISNRLHVTVEYVRQIIELLT